MAQSNSKEHFVELCKCIMNRFFAGKELGVIDAAVSKKKVANAALLGWNACLHSETYADARKSAHKIASEYFNNDNQIKNAILDAIELKWREFRDDDEEFEAVKVTEIDGKMQIVICNEDELLQEDPTGPLFKMAATLKNQSDILNNALNRLDKISIKPPEMADFWRLAGSIMDDRAFSKDKFQNFVFCKDNMLATAGGGAFAYCELPKDNTDYPDGIYAIMFTGSGYGGVYWDNASEEVLAEFFSQVEAVKKEFPKSGMKGIATLTRDDFLCDLQAECEKHIKEANVDTECTIDDGYILALQQVANKFKLKTKVGYLNKEPTFFAKGTMENKVDFYFVVPLIIAEIDDEDFEDEDY